MKNPILPYCQYTNGYEIISQILLGCEGDNKLEKVVGYDSNDEPIYSYLEFPSFWGSYLSNPSKENPATISNIITIAPNTLKEFIIPIQQIQANQVVDQSAVVILGGDNEDGTAQNSYWNDYNIRVEYYLMGKNIENINQGSYTIKKQATDVNGNGIIDSNGDKVYNTTDIYVNRMVEEAVIRIVSRIYPNSSVTYANDNATQIMNHIILTSKNSLQAFTDVKITNSAMTRVSYLELGYDIFSLPVRITYPVIATPMELIGDFTVAPTITTKGVGRE